MYVGVESSEYASWACGQSPYGCDYEANFRAIAYVVEEKRGKKFAMVVLLSSPFLAKNNFCRRSPKILADTSARN